MVILAVYLE